MITEGIIMQDGSLRPDPSKLWRSIYGAENNDRYVSILVNVCTYETTATR